ncbi:MAG: hypothetical protein ACRC2J_01130, partial [Microcoleaceae cyanobacterium]
MSGDLGESRREWAENKRRESAYQREQSRKALAKKLPTERPKAPTGLNLKPGNLSEKNYKDFADSGISKEIADLNVVRITNNDTIAKVLGWKGYSHTPGWYAEGVDITTGELRQDWQGQ